MNSLDDQLFQGMQKATQPSQVGTFGPNFGPTQPTPYNQNQFNQDISGFTGSANQATTPYTRSQVTQPTQAQAPSPFSIPSNAEAAGNNPLVQGATTIGATALGAPAPVAAIASHYLDPVLGHEIDVTLGSKGVVPALASIGTGGLYGIADSFLSQASRTQVEQNKWDALRNQGVKVPENAGQKAPNAGFHPELAADFVGKDPASGGWVNNVFAQSRNEGDLKPDDIVGYADWIGQFGPQWINIPLEQKEAIAGYALQNGLVREHHGTIDINFTPELMQFAQQTTVGASQQQQANQAAALQAQQNAQFAGIEKTNRDQMAAAQKQQSDAANRQMSNQNLLAMMQDAQQQRQQAQQQQTGYADYFKPVIDNMRGTNGQSTTNNQ